MENNQERVSDTAYQKWLAAISASLGLLWLLSGLNKIYSADFIANFGDYTKSQIESVDAFGPYEYILNTLVVPHGVFFGQVISYSELVIGLGLMLAGIWNFFYYTQTGRWVLAAANAAAFLLMLNIILSAALPLPWIDPNRAYTTGLSIDYLVLLITFFSAIAYFKEK